MGDSSMSEDPIGPEGVGNGGDGTEPPVLPHNLQQLLLDKSTLEQANFNLSVELNELRNKYQQLAGENTDLKLNLSQMASDNSERERLRTRLEESRDNLANDKIGLQNEIAKFGIERERSAEEIAALNRDRQRLEAEMMELKRQMEEMAAEKVELGAQLKSLNQQKTEFSMEKQQFEAEKDILGESRKWFTQEIANRDNQISTLRVEVNNMEMSLTEYKEKYDKETGKMKMETSDLLKQVELAKKQYDELAKKMDGMVEEHAKEIKDMEQQLSLQTSLAKQWQEAHDKADQLAHQLHDQLNARNEVSAQTQSVLEEVRQEVLDRQLEHSEELGRKEAQINELKEELHLRGRNRVHVDITEDELAHLSPAAAETARLLRGGKSLTEMIKEHARLAGELAEAKEIAKQYEATIREMCSEIERRAPQLAMQKKVFEEREDENEHLRDQLKYAEEARKDVLTERDNALNELAFSKAEIQRMQRDFAKVNRQLNHLMFANEKQRIAEEEGALDETFNDERLFKNIVEIRQRNLELEAELENERASAAHAFREQQNAELEKLKENLGLSQQREEAANSQIEALNNSYAKLKEQADKLKTLVDNSVGIEEMRLAKLKTEEAVAKVKEAEMTINRLEEYNKMLKEEKDKREKFLEERFQLSEANVQSMRATNAKLEVAFETQKKQTEDAIRQIESMQKEIEALGKNNDKLKLDDSEKLGKIRMLNDQLAAAQQEISSLRVQYRNAMDEVEAAKREVGMLKGQIEVLKDSVKKEHDQMQALNELTKRMSKIEETKTGEANSQLEIMLMERDTLKATVNSLTEQNNMLRVECRQIQTRHEQEVASVNERLKEKAVQMSAVEKELLETRDKLVANAAAQQAQQTEAESVQAMPIDRMRRECVQLKAQTQTLEMQCAELSKQLQEAEGRMAKITEEKSLLEQMIAQLEQSLKEKDLAVVEKEKTHKIEKEEIEKKVEEAVKEKDEATNNLSDLKARNSQVTQLAKRYRSQCEEQKKTIESLQAELKDINAKLEQARAQPPPQPVQQPPAPAPVPQGGGAIANQLRQQLLAANKAKDNAESEMNLVQFRLRALNSQVDKMKETNTSLQEENEKLKKRVQELEQEIAVLQATTGTPLGTSTPKRNVLAAEQPTVLASPLAQRLPQQTQQPPAAAMSATVIQDKPPTSITTLVQTSTAPQTVTQPQPVQTQQQLQQQPIALQRASFFSNPVIESYAKEATTTAAPFVQSSQFKWTATSSAQQKPQTQVSVPAPAQQAQSQSVVKVELEEKRVPARTLFTTTTTTTPFATVTIASAASSTTPSVVTATAPISQQPAVLAVPVQQQAPKQSQQPVTSSQPHPAIPQQTVVSLSTGTLASSTSSTTTSVGQPLSVIAEANERSVSEELVTRAAATSSATSAQAAQSSTNSAPMLISPGQLLFGKSAIVQRQPLPTSTSAQELQEERKESADVTSAVDSAAIKSSGSEEAILCEELLSHAQPVHAQRPSAEQSSFVSGSHQQAMTLAEMGGERQRAASQGAEEDITQNDSPSESRDSLSGTAPVSSSDASRKRAASANDGTAGSSIMGELELAAKRQRESPSEAVTSSEEQRRDADEREESLMMADLEGEGNGTSNEAQGMDIEELEEDSSRRQQLPQQAERVGDEEATANEDVSFIEPDAEEEREGGMEEDMEELSDEANEEGMDDEEEEEVYDEEDEDEEEFDDDALYVGEDEDNLVHQAEDQAVRQQQFNVGRGGGLAQRIRQQAQAAADVDDDIVVLSSDDSDDDEGNDDNSNDLDVGQGQEDEPQDDELIEENDDGEGDEEGNEHIDDPAAEEMGDMEGEGGEEEDAVRTSGNASAEMSGEARQGGQPPRIRMPRVFDNEDQCSSSNETSESQQSLSTFQQSVLPSSYHHQQQQQMQEGQATSSDPQVEQGDGTSFSSPSSSTENMRGRGGQTRGNRSARRSRPGYGGIYRPPRRGDSGNK